MVFSSLRLGIVIRVFFIFILLLFLVFSLNHEQWYVTSAVSGLTVLLLLLELIFLAERSEHQLARFMMALKSKDFCGYSLKDAEKTGNYFLKNAFSAIISEIQNIRIEKEIHYRYLQMVVEHVSVALICFSPDGRIHFQNKAADELLECKTCKKITDLSGAVPELPGYLEKFEPGEQRVIKINISGKTCHLLARCAVFKLREEEFRLVSLQDIKSELEERELESWQKLIRVLTHEIMNSVTPISSLSEAMNEMLSAGEGNRKDSSKLTDKEIANLRESLISIESRSKGLVQFIGSYKRLTRLPEPDPENVPLAGLFKEVVSLIRPEAKKYDIEIETRLSDPELKIFADKEQMKQVLINLLKNSIDSLKEVNGGSILLSAFPASPGRVLVQVKDNGPGISPDIIDNIFIPFFTTKKGGSGIGLSLSREIARKNKGYISVHSEPGEGVMFNLELLS